MSPDPRGTGPKLAEAQATRHKPTSRPKLKTNTKHSITTISFDALSRISSLLYDNPALLQYLNPDGTDLDTDQLMASGLPHLIHELQLDSQLATLSDQSLTAHLLFYVNSMSHIAPLLETLEDCTTLKHMEIIAKIFDCLDFESILSLSKVCRSLEMAVRGYGRMLAFGLPVSGGEVKSNLGYWRGLTDFFFLSAVKVVPIDRAEYKTLQPHFKSLRALFPITPDAASAHTYVTFDCINHNLIASCDHDKPLAHTSAAERSLDCNNKVATRTISLSDFLLEYKRRLRINDDALLWGMDTSLLTPHHICLMLKSIFDALDEYVREHGGKLEYRKTEFISNASHMLVHRIWLQVEMQWDCRGGKGPQNSLYLTIADHYRCCL